MRAWIRVFNLVIPLLPAAILNYRASKRVSFANIDDLEPAPMLTKRPVAHYQTRIPNRVLRVSRNPKFRSFDEYPSFFISRGD